MQYKYDVSVIIPAYNQEHFIEETIKSVLSQEFNGRYEVLISDDGSIDKTWDIIQKYSTLPNIKLNKLNINSGYWKSYNWLINNAEGKYIAYIDGDDLWYKYKLQNAFDLLEADLKCALVFSKSDVETLDGRIYRNFVNKNLSSLKITKDFLLRHRALFGNSTKVFRAECKEQLVNGLRDWRTYDYWQHLRCLEYGYARVTSDQEEALYRMHGRAAGKEFDEKILRVYNEILDEGNDYNADINASILVSVFLKLLKRNKIRREELNILKKTVLNFSILKVFEVIFWIWSARLRLK